MSKQYFKARAEHVVAALLAIEQEVEKSSPTALYPTLYNRRLEHAVALFCADEIADAILEHKGDER